MNALHALLALLSATSISLGQSQAPKLLAYDGAASHFFGLHVATGPTMAIVGAHGHTGYGHKSGSAYLFNTTTRQQIAQLFPKDPSAGGHFGYSVAISGTTAIVGAHVKEAAYLFNTTTGQQTFKLKPKDSASSDFFGIQVGISGTTAIVGAYADDDNGSASGSAYLFNTTTGQQTFKLLPGDGASNDYFGHGGVAISGTTAIVAAYNSNSGSGSAYLFNTTTGQQTFKLLPGDPANGDEFGYSIAISGTTAIVGARSNDDNGSAAGSAYLFNTATGKQIAKLLPGDGATGDNFGSSVAVSGTTAIVGASSGSASGSAYLFNTTTGQQIAKLLPSDGAAGDSFGQAVAISGTTVIVGSWLDDDKGTDSGSAYIFSLNQPPIADIAFDQLTYIGTQPIVTLDGTGSSDAEDVSPVTVHWIIDEGTASETTVPSVPGSFATYGSIQIPLGFGTHTVKLIVNDSKGASGEATKLLTLSPAALSLLNIDDAKFFFKYGKLKIKGEIALPIGVNYTDLSPVSRLTLDVGPVTVVPSTALTYPVKGGKKDKWEYDAATGLTKVDIDWRGARFDFREKNFPVELKSSIITSDQTVLAFKWKEKDINGAFSVGIDAATLSVSETGVVTETTSTGVGIEVEQSGKEVTLTLPFPLTGSSQLTFGGALSSHATVSVATHMKSSVGRFRIEALFDPSVFPAGVATTPREITLQQSVGLQGYPGESLLTTSNLKVDGDNKWKSVK